MPTSTYAIRFTDDAAQPITDAGVCSIAELVSGDVIGQFTADAQGYSSLLRLQPGVLYRITTQSPEIGSAIIMPARSDIILISPMSARTASQLFGVPYTLVVPFDLLASEFAITVSGAWVGTVSGGGMSSEWLSNNGADWQTDGTLTIPLEAAALRGASYWRVEVAAVATITHNADTYLDAFSPLTVEATYDLGGATALTTASARRVFVFDASTPTAEIGFRFLALNDPGLTVTEIRGEVIVQPYVLQTGQST